MNRVSIIQKIMLEYSQLPQRNSKNWLSLKDFECEVWKDIKGFEGFYCVSNYGRVKSLHRIIVRKTHVTQTVKERILKQTKNSNGNCCVSLIKPDNKKLYRKVHVLVAKAFCKNPNNEKCINHKDENKENNIFLNLEYCSYLYNLQYNNGSLSEVKSTGFEYKFKQGWHKIAISFNKRALKAYIDGNRVVNLPRVQQPTWFCFHVPYDYENLTFVRNVVLAKGAVELYDRNAQNMSAVEKAIAETGKFVTNNILFETGKATLKPESMEEIQKVAEYMKKNPTARFEVQGHTDNQGSDKINDPLSQERAEAVVKALEGQGVDPFNLRPVGKGSHEPVADNSTEAGRAQNRRVEFIKR